MVVWKGQDFAQYLTMMTDRNRSNSEAPLQVTSYYDWDVHQRTMIY